ncbi:MAG: DNA polymerase III subunit gamma/tau [Syntrophobacteraceae bacterium]|jgi:DNA polymerase-3 subunit gamma/tau
MSYLVIARKWRPQTFEEVVGQPHATRTLQNAIRLERIAHAYLFTGARGVGKTSVARILAKALNCEKGPSPTPCNQCSNCREISQGNSVDVIEIDGASNRGIDNIRELRETARYRPAKALYKVYIIDEVHMLTPEAFNALLKTLEEPPSHVIFIFATTEPHKIPATILSRCQRFDFRRLGLQQIVEHLRRITSQEGADFSDGILYAIAREADGSMRDSQSLLEQLLAFCGDGLPDVEILDILGVIDRQSILRAAEAILSGNAVACLQLVEDIYRRGIDSRRFCQHLCDHFRNLLFMAVAEGGEIRVDLPEDEKKMLKDQAAGTTAESLHVYFQMLLRGEQEIRRSSMPKIALEMLVLRMAQLPRLESIDAVLDRIAKIELGLKEEHKGSAGSFSGNRAVSEKKSSSALPSAPPVQDQPGDRDRANLEAKSGMAPPSGFNSDLGPPPMPSDFTGQCEPPPMPEQISSMEAELPGAPPPAPKPASPVCAAKAVEGWQGFVKSLESHNPILWAKVSHCSVKVFGESLELEVPEMFEKSANDPEFIRNLEDASQAFFGARLKWVIMAKSSRTSEAPAARAASKNVKPSNAKQIAGHVAVQQAIEILGAELVEVKPFGGAEPGVSRGGKKKSE